MSLKLKAFWGEWGIEIIVVLLFAVVGELIWHYGVIFN